MRLQKTLEDANLKLGSVLSDILCKSGRAILAALIAGKRGPGKLVDLAKRNIKNKRVELVEALRGRASPHHPDLLRIHLNLIEALSDIDIRVGKILAPIKDSGRLLTTLRCISCVWLRA